ncbi:MAG: hypothetical protein QM811_03370 [Pirellulales bacterium]
MDVALYAIAVYRLAATYAPQSEFILTRRQSLQENIADYEKATHDSIAKQQLQEEEQTY